MSYALLAVAATVTLLGASALAGEKVGGGQKSFFWQVRSKSATVYILGSVHMAKPDIYPLPRKIDESFAKAQTLALEADPAKATDEKLLPKMLAAALYPGEETLSGHLSRETFDLAAAETEKLGLPLETFERCKPWFLAMTIESLEFQRLGYDPANGLDIHFAREAAGKKRIIELESFDYQIGLLNGFSEREQELFLRYTIKDLANLNDEIGELMAAWRGGDAKGMEGLITRTLNESPDFRPLFAKLFDRRNQEMAAKIEQMLKGRETVFVVVGAAHLIGEKGVIELLNGRGFKVEQL